MRKRHKMAWMIAEADNGSFSLWHGERPVLTGLERRATAELHIQRNRIPHEQVWFVESDSYRTNVTKNFEDPNERQERNAAHAGSRGKVEVEIDPSDPRPARTRYLARYGRGRK